jgi:hypothetical protein
MAIVSTDQMTRTALFVALLATTAPKPPGWCHHSTSRPELRPRVRGALLCATPATPVQETSSRRPPGPISGASSAIACNPRSTAAALRSPPLGVATPTRSVGRLSRLDGFRTVVFTPYGVYPAFMGLDIENGYLFTAVSHGIQAWDLHSTPKTPVLLGKDQQVSVPYWAVGEVDKYPMRAVDAPSG